MKNLGPILAVLSTVFFWGSSFPVMSFLLETVTPMILATGRFSLAAFLSLLWCVYNYKKRISFNHLIRFLIAGMMILYSSEYFIYSSLCGFKPNIAISGLLLKYFI